MKLLLRIWRQKNSRTKGGFVDYPFDKGLPGMSFLECLDALNEDLLKRKEEAIAFDHDCREGICGSCGVVINGVAHGPQQATTTCQLYLRHFRDGEKVTVEPWRARAFPVIKDLVVDRSALDRIMAGGGFISATAGSAPEANSIAIPKSLVEEVTDAAACIGCGACVAACPNASAMLFTAAKVAHLNLLPQGHPERFRTIRMVQRMEREGFGSCTNHGECEAVCPKKISINFISRLNWEMLAAGFR